MYCKTNKLYPFSKKNFAIIRAYADKLSEQAIVAENLELFEKSDSLSAKAIEIYGLGYDAELRSFNDDGKVIWMTGKDIGKAKEYLAIASM